MSFFLRKIRKAKWYKDEKDTWLADGELQADSLVDLKTDDNALSVWYIEHDKSNLKRVIAALGANTKKISQR